VYYTLGVQNVSYWVRGFSNGQSLIRSGKLVQVRCLGVFLLPASHGGLGSSYISASWARELLVKVTKLHPRAIWYNDPEN
jgi:hypothetical protein